MRRYQTPLGIALAAVLILGVVMLARHGASGRRDHRDEPATDPAQARDYVANGRHLLEQQRLREADEAFRLAAQADPNFVDAYRGLAAVAYEAAEKHRDSARLAALVGRLHVDRGEWEQAAGA